MALAIGGVSGVLGTALTSSYLSDYAVQLSELTVPLRLSQERPRNFPSSYKEAVEKFVASSLPSIVEVYKGKPGALGYTLQDRSHIGVVLTSDGWVGVYTGMNGSLTLKDSVLRIQNQMYPVMESVYDSATRLLFVKVTANDLPVVAFGKGSETQLGEQVFIAESPTAFLPANVTEHRFQNAGLFSSDAPNRFLLTDKSIESGRVVFNLNGEVISIATEQNRLLPIEAISPALRALLEQKKIIRPSLGVQYVDLAHTISLSPEVSRSYRSGALLFGALSVPRGSAARKAGLQAGDILLSVNGETIDLARGLDELIAQYRTGDHIQILLDRKGTSQTVEVILGERKE